MIKCLSAWITLFLITSPLQSLLDREYLLVKYDARTCKAKEYIKKLTIHAQKLDKIIEIDK